jgi:hypothetical protein
MLYKKVWVDFNDFTILTMLCQFFGDVVEFMNCGKNGLYGTIDRSLAMTTASTSIIFIFNNNFVYWGPALYISLFLFGTIFWFIQIVLVRIDCDVPNLWCLCHILWHLLPSIGGVFLGFSSIA